MLGIIASAPWIPLKKASDGVALLPRGPLQNDSSSVSLVTAACDQEEQSLPVCRGLFC